jgi:hypothetical protein
VLCYLHVRGDECLHRGPVEADAANRGMVSPSRRLSDITPCLQIIQAQPERARKVERANVARTTPLNVVQPLQPLGDEVTKTL